MGIITTVAAVGTAEIAVANLVTKGNLITARNASVLIQSMITVAAPVRVVRLHGSAMAIAMTTITTAAANMMAVIAVAKAAKSTSIPTARSVSARTPKLKRKGAAPVKNNARRPLMWAMVVVTITTTTAAVVGTKETAVGKVATRDNSCTAANVNA